APLTLHDALPTYAPRPQVLLGVVVPVAFRPLVRHAQRRAARHDRHTMHRIRARHDQAQDRVTGLVVRDPFPVLLAEDDRPLRTEHDLLQRVEEIRLPDLILVPARRQQRGLVHRLRRSAPLSPGVAAAISPRSTSFASGTRRVCTSRIAFRPFLSGRFTTTRRSNRPARSSALSSTSGWFVAAITMIPSRPVKPSISARIWFSVCSCSLAPPMAICPRARPIESSSSMKMIAGAFSRAWRNRSRTRAAPTPTIISTNSEPAMEKNGTPASPATAFARSVFPVPGGPTSSTPFGGTAP